MFLVSSSFPSPSYIFGTFIFFFSFSFSFFFFFFFYSSLIMASDFGFAILGRLFHYMDGDFRALHWLLLLLLLLLQHLVLLANPSTDPLSLSLLMCLCYGCVWFYVQFYTHWCGCFLGSKCIKWATFCILQDYPWIDVIALNMVFGVALDNWPKLRLGRPGCISLSHKGNCVPSFLPNIFKNKLCRLYFRTTIIGTLMVTS